jgi:hypothetical protein
MEGSFALPGFPFSRPYRNYPNITTKERFICQSMMATYIEQYLPLTLKQWQRKEWISLMPSPQNGISPCMRYSKWWVAVLIKGIPMAK